MIVFDENMRQRSIMDAVAAWYEAQPRLLCHLHHNPFIAHPEYVTLCADVVGRLKLGLSVDQT